MSVSIEKIADNFTRININDLTLWFSYETCIAFRAGGFEFFIRKNDWTTTTGKHLNQINDNKGLRISGTDFEKELAKLNVAWNWK